MAKVGAPDPPPAPCRQRGSKCRREQDPTSIRLTGRSSEAQQRAVSRARGVRLPDSTPQLSASMRTPSLAVVPEFTAEEPFDPLCRRYVIHLLTAWARRDAGDHWCSGRARSRLCRYCNSDGRDEVEPDKPRTESRGNDLESCWPHSESPNSFIVYTDQSLQAKNLELYAQQAMHKKESKKSQRTRWRMRVRTVARAAHECAEMIVRGTPNVFCYVARADT